jgi:hypothetical protein
LAASRRMGCGRERGLMVRPAMRSIVRRRAYRAPHHEGRGCCKLTSTGKSRQSRQAPKSKIFRFTGIRICGINRPVPRPRRDVSRSSRYVGRRMRWPRQSQAQRLGFRKGSRPGAGRKKAAGGEIVWSWRRDPGATLAASVPSTTGARKAASPGRARISRKTIARGRPGCLGCTCQNRVHSFAFFRTRRCGCIQRPAFPAPSTVRRDNEIANLGQLMPRERERLCRAAPPSATVVPAPVSANRLRPKADFGASRGFAGGPRPAPGRHAGRRSGEKVTPSDHLLALRPLAFLV